MVLPANNIPTILAAFGATGDLMRRKVIPALYYLYEKKELPQMFRVVGFSRRDLTDETFREFVAEIVLGHTGKKISKKELADFLAIFQFERGDFDEADSYAALKKKFDVLDGEWGVCANKLFYLSVAPEFYEVIFKHLAESRLSEPCGPDEGWTRVMVEKPFGVDTETAKRLDMLLGSYFKEEQIYRIDHYLAKEMLQNILTFRFSNNLFELTWGNQLIESVRISMLEEIGVEKRGPFYDGVGAFRDVGQNHFLQILALITMEHPESFEAAAIQKKRADILSRLVPITGAGVRSSTVRAQYDGYRDIDGVAKDSNTETFFKVRAELDHPKWKGVPIIMEGGKRLGAAQKQIVITFKHPEPCLCPPGPHHKNEVIIRLEPREEILIEFWSKTPGFTFATERREFHYMLREPSVHVPYIEEYAKLLVDGIRGDQALFIATDEVRAMWRFTDPILEAWQRNEVPL
ncbi:glucose-6-phosphate dehydrogenase, partial [Candidatus Kaiserbacteria bacterium]|nr:glucose-6-phosphate dehydrogenase [Candidatus Kaiserbacteria bacterium]